MNQAQKSSLAFTIIFIIISVLLITVLLESYWFSSIAYGMERDYLSTYIEPVIDISRGSTVTGSVYEVDVAYSLTVNGVETQPDIVKSNTSYATVTDVGQGFLKMEIDTNNLTLSDGTAYNIDIQMEKEGYIDYLTTYVFDNSVNSRGIIIDNPRYERYSRGETFTYNSDGMVTKVDALQRGVIAYTLDSSQIYVDMDTNIPYENILLLFNVSGRYVIEQLQVYEDDIIGTPEQVLLNPNTITFTDRDFDNTGYASRYIDVTILDADGNIYTPRDIKVTGDEGITLEGYNLIRVTVHKDKDPQELNIVFNIDGKVIQKQLKYTIEQVPLIPTEVVFNNNILLSLEEQKNTTAEKSLDIYVYDQDGYIYEPENLRVKSESVNDVNVNIKEGKLILNINTSTETEEHYITFNVDGYEIPKSITVEKEPSLPETVQTTTTFNLSTVTPKEGYHTFPITYKILNRIEDEYKPNKVDIRVDNDNNRVEVDGTNIKIKESTEPTEFNIIFNIDGIEITKVGRITGKTLIDPTITLNTDKDFIQVQANTYQDNYDKVKIKLEGNNTTVTKTLNRNEHGDYSFKVEDSYFTHDMNSEDLEITATLKLVKDDKEIKTINTKQSLTVKQLKTGKIDFERRNRLKIERIEYDGEDISTDSVKVYLLDKTRLPSSWDMDDKTLSRYVRDNSTHNGTLKKDKVELNSTRFREREYLLVINYENKWKSYEGVRVDKNDEYDDIRDEYYEDVFSFKSTKYGSDYLTRIRVEEYRYLEDIVRNNKITIYPEHEDRDKGYILELRNSREIEEFYKQKAQVIIDDRRNTKTSLSVPYKVFDVKADKMEISYRETAKPKIDVKGKIIDSFKIELTKDGVKYSNKDGITFTTEINSNKHLELYRVVQDKLTKITSHQGYSTLTADILNISGEYVIVETDTTFNPVTPSTPEYTRPPLSFIDTVGHWADTEIGKLYQQGYLSGYGDGTFQPNKYSTLSEAIVMIVKSLKLDVTTNVGGEWYTNYVLTARNHGLLNGLNSNTYNNPITREQLAVLLMNYTKHQGKGRTGQVPTYNFTDRNQITPSSLSAIDFVIYNEIMRGMPDDSFGPKIPLTRAQVVQTLVNL